jgi:hypothetical protein
MYSTTSFKILDDITTYIYTHNIKSIKSNMIYELNPLNFIKIKRM